MEANSPAKILGAAAARHGVDVLSKDFPRVMDAQDPLAAFRKRFAVPLRGSLPAVDPMVAAVDRDCVYMCGNSLGLKPTTADTHMQAQLDKWATMGVEMHFEQPLPAASCDEYLREEMGRLVGSSGSCVCLMNGLTVNLHLLLMSFYQPTASRFKILIEGHAFPSDRYAMRSQAELRGLDPDQALLEVTPRPGEHTIRTDDILKILQEEGPSIAVVCLSGVQYYTGQKFDMDAITAAARSQGCLVGWDLAHAVGNVEIKLDEWGVDFACWCTYKYLNSGPGCIGGAYVNARHKDRRAPQLRGWWSNKTETRFEMRDQCDPAGGVDGFKLCNPPPFLVALVKASLEIFDEAGMERILAKQLLLTGYLEVLLETYFGRGEVSLPSVSIITPKDPKERGCQLSLEFSFPLHKVHKELQKRGVVCDVRLPNVMRVAPAPLYNSFSDVHAFVSILQEVFVVCKSEAA